MLAQRSRVLRFAVLVRAANADILDAGDRVLIGWGRLKRSPGPTRPGIVDDGGMPRSLKTYDHRLRELVRRTGDVSLATSVGVPRSTAAGWSRGPSRTTVSLDVLSMGQQDLQTEVLCLRGRVEKLRAVARVLVASIKAFDIDLGRRRIPDGAAKSVLVRAVERGREVLKLHNERLPHSAFRGQTPDEMYFGRGDGVPDDLELARDAAKNERLAVNRSLSCGICETSPDSDAA